MTTRDFINLWVGNAVLFAAIQAVAIKLLNHVFDKRLQHYQRELRRRDRAAMLAELFAEWISLPKDPKRLNQLTWEASLWLPPEIVKALKARLSNAPNAPDLKSVLIAARKQLWSASDNVTEQDIIHFLPPEPSDHNARLRSAPAP